MTPDPEEIRPEDQDPLSATVSFQIRSLLAAAERAAEAVRAQAGQRAEEIVRAADEEARRRLEEARREADDLLAARRRQITELSDSVAREADAVLGQLDSAGRARRTLDELLGKLADTTARLAETGQSSAAAAPAPGSAPRERPSEPASPAASGPPPGPGRFPLEAAPSPASGPERSSPEAGSPRDPEPAPAATADGPAPEEPRGLSGPQLVAHQMAQAGSTRAEVAAHLQRTFGLQDPHQVLNDIFPDTGSEPASG